VKQKNNAYSIIGEQGSVLVSFYAECDADAYVEAYLRAQQLGHGATNGPHCKLVRHDSTDVVSCPFLDEEKTALRLAAKFCATMPTLASFRAMRTLATTMRVSWRTGIRCALAKRLFDEGYRTRKPEKHKRRLEHITGSFYLEKDLTKTMLDFADWMAREPS
jgi:hypothetical protein